MSQLFGREIVIRGKYLSLHILPFLVFSGKRLASGNSPSLGFSQIKWLARWDVNCGCWAPLAARVMWQIYQMIAGV